MEEAYVNLINAIILQAFKDYYFATKKLKRDPANLDAQRLVYDVESFCRSSWCEWLTDLDGDWLLGRIKLWKRTSLEGQEDTKSST